MFDPRPRKPVEISLAPLIDVVLILVIFVMLSASFTERRELEVDVPESAEGTASNDKALTVGIQRDGVVLLDGIVIPGEGVTEALRSRWTAGARVVVEAHRDVELHALVGVLDSAREAGFGNASIAVDRPAARIR
jgi:biopolymer transport protein ExbD